jgi:hypothetical protein
MWDQLTTRLNGQIVVLEPLAARHEEGMFAASQHPEIWTWLAPVGDSREYFSAWFAASLADSEAGREGVFRKHMLMPGIGVRDSAFYSVTDEDWPKVRTNLERRLAAAQRQEAL